MATAGPRTSSIQDLVLSIGTASDPLVKPECGQVLAARIRMGRYCSKSPSLRACMTAWLRTGSASRCQLTWRPGVSCALIIGI